ncbi:P-loop containing nucleoside triphosphate hydrolase protein [Ampelomyces quisqualis]|uniref:P-loop containing nucleoside triphosphate hydrolase protein n=1 Tax=Ampelomyces quisqualis TaxID=50730 RepID=A0A6A5QJ44_AMPQU|nr:P-loop containing nucleoside triphosphate hydrolase protein [Ampelomyces quisqualis]
MTGHSLTVQSSEDQTGREYFHHSAAQRVNTDVVLTEALRKQYPHLELVVVPVGMVNLLAYASAGYAKATPLEDAVRDPVYGVGVKWRSFTPPYRRIGGGDGAFVEAVLFGKFMYRWKDQEAILYVADGRDGVMPYSSRNHYILTTNEHKVDELIKLAATWGSQLHDEVWVFDSGYWQKSAELYNSIMKAEWSNVILDEDMKKALIADVTNFFDGQRTYQDLKVPWKRGVIYYGPPGNGKTISIKATMHTLYQRGVAEGDSRLKVPTLYVRTLASYGGPEFALRLIFSKARQEAPCYLVFEDLDSIVSDNVRSYFLNEVDGLTSNDGIMMVGSTNHLDRLDPGIAKRPSRFDRKYFFPNPNFDQRVQYAQFWQRKLESNKDVAFPDALCNKIAGITDKFSFAYMQEAFVATLLAIAVRGGKDADSRWSGPHDPLTSTMQTTPGGDDDDDDDDNDNDNDRDMDKLELWIEIQKQVKILREEMAGRLEYGWGSRVAGPAWGRSAQSDAVQR